MSSSNRLILFALALALFAVLLFLDWPRSRASDEPAPVTADAYTKAERGHPVQLASGSRAEPALAAPTGTFVSDHHVRLGASVGLTSVCNTTPGAECQITVTKDGVTKSLLAETTDAGGAAYWNDWTPQSIGLSVGSWQVKATATLGHQSKTALDALALTVAP